MILPQTFNRLAWSNLAAQSAEQVGLAATPLIAVLALGAGAGATGALQTAQTLSPEGNRTSTSRWPQRYPYGCRPCINPNPSTREYWQSYI